MASKLRIVDVSLDVLILIFSAVAAIAFAEYRGIKKQVSSLKGQVLAIDADLSRSGYYDKHFVCAARTIGEMYFIVQPPQLDSDDIPREALDGLDFTIEILGAVSNVLFRQRVQEVDGCRWFFTVNMGRSEFTGHNGTKLDTPALCGGSNYTVRVHVQKGATGLARNLHSVRVVHGLCMVPLVGKFMGVATVSSGVLAAVFGLWRWRRL